MIKPPNSGLQPPELVMNHEWSDVRIVFSEKHINGQPVMISISIPPDVTIEDSFLFSKQEIFEVLQNSENESFSKSELLKLFQQEATKRSGDYLHVLNNQDLNKSSIQ